MTVGKRRARGLHTPHLRHCLPPRRVLLLLLLQDALRLGVSVRAVRLPPRVLLLLELLIRRSLRPLLLAPMSLHTSGAPGCVSAGMARAHMTRPAPLTCISSQIRRAYSSAVSYSSACHPPQNLRTAGTSAHTASTLCALCQHSPCPPLANARSRVAVVPAMLLSQLVLQPLLPAVIRHRVGRGRLLGARFMAEGLDVLSVHCLRPARPMSPKRTRAQQQHAP